MLGTQLPRQASHPDDTVILYFAGHGQREADPSGLHADGFAKYLLPYDGDPEDPFSTALGMEEVADIIRRLRAERVVFIVDSCFSGAAGGRTLFDPGQPAPRAQITAEFLERIATAGVGRVVLTASGANEVAEEHAELGQGVFTHFLLRGLEGAADDNRDGLIDVDEIYRFVYRRVSDATSGRQNPERRAPRLVGEVLIGRASVLPQR